jgi:hypothetical protein
MSATETRNALIAKIDALLKAANGRRRVRTMTVGTIMGLIADVADGHEFSWEDGGTVANAYDYAASSTLALVAKVDGKVYLGIAIVDAKATTPGRAWSALQPFYRTTGPAGDAASKWAAWTTAPDVFEIHGPELDALIETNAGVA